MVHAVKTGAVVEAERGERTIEVRIKFFTNDLAEGEGNVLARHAWDKGVVLMSRNEAHDIRHQGNPRPFNSLMELPAAVEDVLLEHGVKIHAGDRSRKWLVTG